MFVFICIKNLGFYPSAMSTTDDLLAEIFAGLPAALYAEFEEWLRQSRRFQAFATVYRAKIRAKLRNARDAGGLLDVRAELATAARLLREERFSLEYEAYAAAKQRGPDFTVTYKTHTRFNVEVRRVRAVEATDGDDEAHAARLMAVLLDKVGQMPPSIVNLLWLIADAETTEADLIRAATTLRQLAERKTEEFFTRRGFESAADYLGRYRRLSGVVLPQSEEMIIWLNPLARHPAPADIVTALRRLGA
ncbi:protein of unknown function [Candidatus Promineifilum breve]|uniref:Uncharacterized protein n=2 Tax=Candidatus Promineifilum breve TaxID=1806508 RepID=A0A160SZN3_9CHLR|nr:protein of unknown function [Candidatus Promineifilum breve]